MDMFRIIMPCTARHVRTQLVTQGKELLTRVELVHISILATQSKPDTSEGIQQISSVMSPYPEELLGRAGVQSPVGDLCLFGQVLCTLNG